MATNDPSQKPGWVWSPSGLVLLAFLTIAAFFLITERWAHVLGALPYLLFLLCPVLHLLMYGWHGHGHTDDAAHQPRSPQGVNRRPVL
jgi:apolipoprotein N-acyltransferase